MDAVATIVVGLAGPLGVALGWWLAHRSEDRRLARGERRSAYLAFIKAAATYRNSSVQRQDDVAVLYGHLAELILVAPSALFDDAFSLVSEGSKLVDTRDDATRDRIYESMWRHFKAFSDGARADLGVDGSAFDVSGQPQTPEGSRR